MAGIAALALGIVVVTAVIANAWATWLADRRALQAVIWAGTDSESPEIEQWEVRAMAAVIWETAPWMRVVRSFMLEHEFEEVAVRAWKDTQRGYDSVRPRKDTELFGETGPF